ncbi:MAG TPA: GntR family transcriptional regulator [Jatrophihabitantaceae bacterium]
MSSLTRREAVLTELRRAVLTGRLRPGERLKEVQLAKDLGVSRPTLREAIYQLIHEGLLVQEDYKGVRVADITAETISDIAVVRTALETIAAKTIAGDKTGESQAMLRQAWDDYDRAAASGDPARENEAHIALHRTIWAASNNSMLQRIWPIIDASINLAISTDQAARHDIQRSQRAHRALVDAILHNRKRDIEKEVRAHIEVNARELLAMLAQRDRE